MSHSLVPYNFIPSCNNTVSSASHEQRLAFLSLRYHHGSLCSEWPPQHSCHFERLCYILYASYLKYLLYHTNYQCVWGGPSFSSSILSCCKIPSAAKDHFSRIEKLALGFTERANLALKTSPE